NQLKIQRLLLYRLPLNLNEKRLEMTLFPLVSRKLGLDTIWHLRNSLFDIGILTMQVRTQKVFKKQFFEFRHSSINTIAYFFKTLITSFNFNSASTGLIVLISILANISCIALNLG